MGGIYGHFAGKEEIWSAVFMAKHPYQALLPLIMSSRGETIEEFLRDTARNMLDTLEERPEIFNLLFIELVEFDGKDIEKLSVELLPVIQQLGQKFFSLKGQLQPISALTIVRAFAGLIISFYITGRFVPPIFRMQIDKQKSLDEFIQIFLHGILDESGSASDADRRENG
jgi:AcrR family transcriptional regulator